jgi:hypothetical protein
MVTNQEIKKPKLIEKVSFDMETKQCTDKIEIISLCHSTGQITLYTTKGEKIDKITLSDLIQELNVEHNQTIINQGSNIFQNIITIKYTPTRIAELHKILSKTNMKNLVMNKTKHCFEAKVQVNELFQVLEQPIIQNV